MEYLNLFVNIVKGLYLLHFLSAINVCYSGGFQNRFLALSD